MLGICKLSVQLPDHRLHHFQHLRLYSANSSTHFPKSPKQSYTNYLVHNLGFSLRQAQSISTKLTNYSNFSDNADSVIHFLKQHGFDDTHIKMAVSSYPQILSANVDQTLKPKFQVFENHGFSASDLVSVILSNPNIVATHMEPIIPDLKAILGSNGNLIMFFRKTHFNMGPTTLRNLISNVALLNKEYGLAISVIRNAILQFPGFYMRDTEVFRNTVVRVEKELGIPRNSGMFTYGIPLLSASRQKKMESTCQMLKSFGWTESDISELKRRNPLIFLLTEENIRKKLGFLMTELGYKPDFLATRSALLSCSLEKRVVPRYRVLLALKEKGLLDYNFYTAIAISEKLFLKKLIEPFKEDAPGLLELYQSSKGCSNIDAISRH